MGRRDAPQLAIALQHIDEGVVGERGGRAGKRSRHQPRDVREGALVLQRRREQRSEIGEKRRALTFADALRHVPRDLRGADDDSARIADRRDGDRHEDLGSVLAPAHGLEMLHRVATYDAAQHLVFLRAPRLGNDHPDRPPDGFGGGVAEHALRGRIPRRDDAAEILADNRVVRGLDDGGEGSFGNRVIRPRRCEPRSVTLLPVSGMRGHAAEPANGVRGAGARP
jgi:hypothetical protein